MTTSYSNIGGSGERRTWVTMGGTATFSGGTSANIIDGSQANTAWLNSGQTTATITFDFGSGNSPIIDEFTWYQDGAHASGTWSFRGSPDGSSWTDLLTGITLGATSATEVHSFTNTTGYRHYGLFQTSGTTSNAQYTKEIEFKISGITVSGATTWSPLYVTPTSITLSGGDLTVASTSAGGSDIASVSAFTGKFYYEFSCTGMDDNNSGVGVADVTQAPQGKGNLASGAVASVSGFIYANGSYASVAIGTPVGHVIGIAVDVGAQLIWFRLDNGNWNASGTANPTTGVGGISLSFMNAANAVAPSFVSSDSSFAGTANFGATSYAYSAPSGYGNWAPAAPSGTWASTETTDAMAFAGGVLGGAWASTEATDIMDATSAPFGTWASTEADDAMAFVGYPELSGVWASVEVTDIMSAAASGPPVTYFNPLTASGGVDFQNLNLTIVNQEAFGQPVGALSNNSHGSGKFYVEFETEFQNVASGVGIANSATTFADFGTALGTIPGYATGGAGIFQDLEGTIWVNGVQQTNWQGISLYRANVGIAVDFTNSLIWFRVNGGHWNGIAAANPATGVDGYSIAGLSGPFYLIGEVVGAYDKLTMNAGASAFSYSAPAGFSAWGDAVGAALPQLDGYASAGLSEVGPSYTQFSSGTVTLSTTQDDDVIVVGVAMGGFWNATTVESVTSTSGLVWKRRNKRWQVGGYKANHSTVINQGLDIEIWWAHAPSALSGEVITINIDSTPYTNPGGGSDTTGVGSMSIIAFGVSDANYTTPWDTHTQAGGYVDNIGNIYYFPATAELSTKAANALLFGFHGDTQADAGITVEPWTYVTSTSGNEHDGNESFLSLVYQVVEEPQFNTNVVVGQNYAGSPTYQAASMMFDSIVATGETGTDQEIVWFWDGDAVNNVIQLSTGNSLVMNYTATNFNLMVLLEVVILSASGLGEVTSISEGQGSLSTLGFERRSRTVTSTPRGPLAVEIWWGWMPMYTSAERPNNDTITINTSGTASGDVIGAIMWGLGGSTGAFGLGDPFWDVNPSVPAVNNSTGSTPPPYATDISTTIPSTLLVAWTGNNSENVPGYTDPFITLIQSYPNTVVPNMQLNSTAPPVYTGFEFLYEPGLVSNETAEFLNGSPEPDGWIVIADAIPVGPPQPPTGTMEISDQQDKFTHTGDYTTIGIASPGGWVGAPENHGVIAATDSEDICGGTPNLGYSPFLGEGWLGWVPASATWASTEGDGDDMGFYGWVLGFGITGQIGAVESKDRLAFSNRSTVTGTMGAVEAKDRWASAGLVLPPGRIHPTTPNKRRLLIIT